MWKLQRISYGVKWHRVIRGFATKESIAGKIIEVGSDQVHAIAVSGIFTTTIDFLRNKAAEQLPEGDVALKQLKSKLITEIEKLASAIERHNLAKMKTADKCMLKGLLAIEYNALGDAVYHFKNANMKSLEAFETAKDFDGKFLCTKIHLLSMIMMNELSPPTLQDVSKRQDYLVNQCKLAFKPLFTCAEVQSALDYNSRKSMGIVQNILDWLGGTKEVQRVLADVSSLRYLVAKKLNTNPATFPLILKETKVVETHGVALGPIPCTGYPICVAVSGDKVYKACAGEAIIRVFDLTTHSEVLSLQGHSQQVKCLLVSENKLYSGSEDGTIRIWKLGSHEQIGCLQVNTRPITCICIAVSGNRLYSCSSDRVLRSWDLDEHKQLREQNLREPFSDMVIANGKLYSHYFSDNNTVTEWDLDRLLPNYSKYIIHPEVSEEGRIACFANVGNLLYTASGDGTIRVWDLNSRTELACLTEHTDAVSRLAIANGRLYSAGVDGKLRIWNLCDHSQIGCFDNSYKGGILSMVILADRLYLAQSSQKAIAVSLI